MEFTDKEAEWLRAALDGKTVQWRNKVTGPHGGWSDAKNFRYDVIILSQPDMFEVRIKPDVIVVNGIEVPAPVKNAEVGDELWIADPSQKSGCAGPIDWSDVEDSWLSLEIVHLDQEAAATHGKAMRAHKQG